MDEPNRECSCFTLQAADSKPIMVLRDPVVTLGVISVFTLIVTVLVFAIYLQRRPATGRRRHSWW